MSDGCIVAIAGDLHVNSTVALCPPEVDFDDNGKYIASPLQLWIWDKWKEYWADVKEKSERYDLPVVAVLNGELADDNYHNTTQLISKNPADQIAASAPTLSMVSEIADKTYVLRGTEAHTGASSSMDEIIARSINAEKDGNNSSRWSLLEQFGGVTFDIAHHPGMGHARAWTRGGDANRLALHVATRYWERGYKAPQLVIRGHNHRPVDSYDNHESRAIVLPSWQLTNSYGYRLGGDWLPIGAAYAICPGDGSYTITKRYWQWPIQLPTQPLSPLTK